MPVGAQGVINSDGRLAPVLNGEEPADIGAEPGYGSFACADGKLVTLSIAHEAVRPFLTG